MDEILTQHLKQLCADRSRAYEILRETADPAVSHEAGLLVDLILGEELSLAAPMWPGVDAVTALPPQQGVAAVRAWRATVAAAQPNRKGMTAALTAFPAWLERLDDTTREMFFDALPKLAPALDVFGEAGITELISAAKACRVAEARTALEFAATYCQTTPEIAAAALHLAVLACTTGSTGVLSELAKHLPFERIEASRQAERLLPALDRACAACGESAAEALALLTQIAESDLASALNTAHGLPKALAHIAPEERAAALEIMRKLVGAMGIRVIGFCLHKLPELYASKGQAHAGRVAEVACAAAERYGVLAGEAVLEGRTEIARQLLSGDAMTSRHTS